MSMSIGRGDTTSWMPRFWAPKTLPSPLFSAFSPPYLLLYHCFLFPEKPVSIGGRCQLSSLLCSWSRSSRPFTFCPLTLRTRQRARQLVSCENLKMVNDISQGVLIGLLTVSTSHSWSVVFVTSMSRLARR